MTEKQADGGDSQATGYADDLEAAFAEAEAAENASAPVEDAEPETEAEDTEADAELEAESAESEADEGEEPDEPEEGEPEADETEPPEHWADGDKEAFAELPDEAKPLYLAKVKSLESGFNRKFEELAGERKELESFKGFKQLFDPFEAQLQQAGHTPESYTRNLVQTAIALRQEPEATIKSLAATYGVDLASFAGKPTGADDDFSLDDDEFADPAIRRLEAKIDGLETNFTQSQQTAVQASQQQIENEFAAFSDAKADDGSELHPGATQLRVMMGTYLNQNPPPAGEGLQASFERAYEAVKWTDSTIREQVMASQTKAVEAEREKQRKADLAKAKKAGRVVKSKSAKVPEAPQVGETWKDEIAKQFDAAMEG